MFFSSLKNVEDVKIESNCNADVNNILSLMSLYCVNLQKLELKKVSFTSLQFFYYITEIKIECYTYYNGQLRNVCKYLPNLKKNEILFLYKEEKNYAEILQDILVDNNNNLVKLVLPCRNLVDPLNIEFIFNLLSKNGTKLRVSFLFVIFFT